MEHISKRSYPSLYKAIIMVMLDMGMINRLEPVKESIPTYYAEHTLSVAEQELTKLTPEQLDTFCSGEHDDRCKLVDNMGLLTADFVIEVLVG